MLGQSAKLTEEKNRWELRVREARQALEFEARTRQERLAALDRQMAEAQALTPDLTEVQRVLVELAEKEKQLEQMRESREAHLGQVAELNGVNQQLKKHMLSLEDKIKLLQTAGAACPVCGQPISPEEAVRVSEEYREEGKRNAEGYRTNSDSINDLKWHVENLKTSAHKIELDLRRKAALQGREALLTQKLREASEAQVERDGLAAEWQALQTALEQKDYAHAEQAALAEVSAKLGALGYSAEEHEQARRLLSELAFYEPDHAQLQAARERLAAERELLGNLEANLERVRQAVAADETQWQALKAETARLAEVGQRIAGQQRQVNDLQGRTAILNRAVGAARQWVENAKNMEAQLGVKQEDLKRSQTERGLFEELRVAFGKKGIQAMLIEAA
ncbi:MAG: hypothetical protein HYR71_01985, partial [Chloroflexi bacterium]|nr:hypothetical protein [Chloroflexota bacterium]